MACAKKFIDGASAAIEAKVSPLKQASHIQAYGNALYTYKRFNSMSFNCNSVDTATINEEVASRWHSNFVEAQ